MKAYAQPPDGNNGNHNGHGNGHGHGHNTPIEGLQGIGILFLAIIVYCYFKNKLRKTYEKI